MRGGPLGLGLGLGLLAALAPAACSVEGVTFSRAREDCAAPGDEDEDGLADCADPSCANAVACREGCGNGRTEAGEACDDGNSVSGDGCDANCTATACGNGIATAGEACDDGNAVGGDGCESDCRATGTGSYQAVGDAMIRKSSAPADAITNFGGSGSLCTQGSAFGAVSRALLAFDLAAVPASATIQSAHLVARLNDQAGIGYTIGVREALAPWSEAAVTWNSQPNAGPVEASLSFQGYTAWRFDVTALVQRWVTTPGSNTGLMLQQDPEAFGSGGQYACFESREAANRPVLEVIVAP